MHHAWLAPWIVSGNYSTITRANDYAKSELVGILGIGQTFFKYMSILIAG
ncbi:MAG: hypothetical protein VX434_00930 [Pseudomonadota bacterium]|nr:hypothetical protein [Pseudomonadota bacterium]